MMKLRIKIKCCAESKKIMELSRQLQYCKIIRGNRQLMDGYAFLEKTNLR